MGVEKKQILIWLNHLGGVSYQMVLDMIHYFGAIEEIWNAKEKHLYEVMQKHGIVADRIVKNRNEKWIETIMLKIQDLEIEAIDIYDASYPAKLKNIYNPPYIIYIKGKKKFDFPLIAIVGSRKATPYGRWAAFKLARELAQWDVGVVSGLALGIDTEGHRGVLEEGGYTIAVLGNGIDYCYPSSNRKLFHRVMETGCILSEYPPGTSPLKHHFPTRNRVISGLTDGVIVVEAAEKSGALITAEYALQQGREVYAVPGNINSEQSRGTNQLIKEGAKPILDIEDVLEDLRYRYPIQNKCKNNSIEGELSEEEYKVYRILLEKPKHIDIISYESGYTASKLNCILTVLEMKGVACQLPGKIFTINR